jgi:hypothetical protein
MNITKLNLQKQIQIKQAELNKLKEVEQYIYNNFEATSAEQDKIFDVITQCKDRKESKILELKAKLLTA